MAQRAFLTDFARACVVLNLVIGAHLALAQTYYIAESGSDTNNCINAPCATLQHVLGLGIPTGATISFGPGVYILTSQLQITTNAIHLQGPSDYSATISCGGRGVPQGLTVNASPTSPVYISYLVFTQCITAINVKSAASITNCNFDRNDVALSSDELTPPLQISVPAGTTPPLVENCNFTNNVGSTGALGISVGTVSNCYFINNVGYDGEGALATGGPFPGTVLVQNSYFAGNQALASNSGTCASACIASGTTMEGCTFENHVGEGAAVVQTVGSGSPTVQIKGCRFHANTMTHLRCNGQAFSNLLIDGCQFYETTVAIGVLLNKVSGSVTVINSQFYNQVTALQVQSSANVLIANCQFLSASMAVAVSQMITISGATFDAVPTFGLSVEQSSAITLTASSFGNCLPEPTMAALYVEGSQMTVSYSIFFNTSGLNSPAVLASVGSTVQLENCMFANNSGSSAVTLNAASSISYCAFVNNSAATGAALTDSAGSTISNSNFVGNTAINGGALLLLSSNSVLSGCTFEGNIATTSGGAIQVAGTQASIGNAVFIDNEALNGGAIAVALESSSTSISGCTFSNNAAAMGGAIVAFSSVQITECALNSNRAINGGAISVLTVAPVFVNDTVVTSNLAIQVGGALFADRARSVVVSDTALTGNTANIAGGGVACLRSTVSLNNVTGLATNIVPESSSLWSTNEFFCIFGSCQFTTTRMSPVNASCGVDSGTVVVGPNGDDNDACGTESLPCATIQQALAIAPLRIQLLPGNYSGANCQVPLLQAIALVGENAATTVFQCSESSGVVVSLGSGSLLQSVTVVLGVTSATQSTVAVSGNVTLQHVVFTTAPANFPASAPFITVQSGNVTWLDVNVTGMVVASSTSPAVFVSASTTLLMSACHFTNNVGLTTLQASSATIQLARSTFTSNRSPTAAMVSTAATVQCESVAFSENSGAICGAAMFNGGTAVVSKCDFQRNQASGAQALSGAICASASNVLVAGSSFTYNIGTSGGALYGTAGSMINMTSCDMQNNSASFGGAVYSEKTATVNLASCWLLNNTAFQSGGGAYVSGSLHALATTILENTASIAAAVQVDEQGLFSLEAMSIVANHQQMGGTGSIVVANAAIFTCEDSSLLNNTGQGQGGAITATYATLTLVRCLLSQNQAQNGGAMVAFGGSLSVNGGSWQGNSATNAGGALFVVQSSCVIANITASANAAGQEGGVVHVVAVQQFVMTGGMFSSNQAHQGGCIFLVETAALLSQVTASGNLAFTLGGFMRAIAGQAHLFNVTLVANNAAIGAGISLLTMTEFTLLNANISFNRAVQAAAVHVDDIDGSHSFLDSVFVGNQATATDGAVSLLANIVSATPLLFGCTFMGNIAPASSALSVRGTATIDQCQFAGNAGPAASAVVMTTPDLNGYASVQVFASSFRANFGSAIAQSGGALIVDNSTFAGNTAIGTGACVQLTSSTLNMQTVQMLNNSASQGGCISLTRSTAVVTSCILANNTAISGNGGAVLLTDTISVMIMNGSAGSCALQSNTALQGGGGAVFSHTSEQVDVACMLSDNKAMFGNNFASDPAALLLSSTQASAVSGVVLSQFAVQIIDVYNNVVLNTPSTIVFAVSNATLQGGLSSVATKGVALFPFLTVVAVPGSQLVIQLSAPALQVPALDLSVHMLPCSPGTELLPGALTCSLCAIGYYQPLNATNRCQVCPTNSTTLGRGAASAEECLCPAGYQQSATGETVFCQLCQPGYMSGQYSSIACQQCSGPTVSTGYGNTECIQCPANAVASSDHTACTCPAGYYSHSQTGTGLPQCEPCSVGSYKSVSGTQSCTACPSGASTSEVGQTTVTQCLCNTATFLNSTSGQCQPCLPGTFASVPGAVLSCQPCPTASVSAGASGSCTPCPAYATADESRTQCQCIPGYFGDGTHSCMPCPDGVECNGGIASAFQGTWALYTPNASQPISSYVCTDACTGGCFQSPNTSACMSASSVPSCYANANYTLTGEVPQWCEVSNGCAGTRSGFMCAQCQQGSFIFGNECVDCASPSYGKYVGMQFLLWAIAIITYMLLAGSRGQNEDDDQYSHQVVEQHAEEPEPVSILQLYDYAQLTFLVLPESFSVLQLLNLRLPASSCYYPRTYYLGFVEKVSQPFLTAVELCITFAVIRLLAPLITGKHIRAWTWLVQPLLALTVTSYEPITEAVLDMLHCIDIGPYRVLADSPSLLCTSAVYTPYRAVAIVFLAIVTGGMPVTLIIFWIRNRSRIADFAFRQKWNVLYGEFRLAWWSVVKLVRRTVLIALVLIPEDTGMGRPYIVVLWCTAMLVTHFLVRPSASPATYNGELLSLSSLLFVAFSSAVMIALPASATAQYAAIMYCVIVVICATLLTMLVMVIYGRSEQIKAAMQLLRASWQFLRTKQRLRSTKVLKTKLLDETSDQQL
eukprot:TRINITY_DN11438_c0_g1_i2.p1 TRINITY_DN11438_c0_g1~~TRINITY_DN11438_c0_g1_i2.p1  ORF type:complete len:2424 (-),score=334.25 TRINITY_DN11438_c0_g1_i2:119-7390(-)